MSELTREQVVEACEVLGSICEWIVRIPYARQLAAHDHALRDRLAQVDEIVAVLYPQRCAELVKAERERNKLNRREDVLIGLLAAHRNYDGPDTIAPVVQGIIKEHDDLQSQLATAQAKVNGLDERLGQLISEKEVQSRTICDQQAGLKQLQSHHATAQARIERLEGAVRAMRASRLAYWRRAADAAGDPADDATVLRDVAKYDALFQICEQALADEPVTGEAKHE